MKHPAFRSIGDNASGKAPNLAVTLRGTRVWKNTALGVLLVVEVDKTEIRRKGIGKIVRALRILSSINCEKKKRDSVQTREGSKPL